jgi:hypothetical protein
MTTAPLLNLPVNVPWQLLAASPDMMDVTFCNARFPYAWRSSLAIWAYEPDPADIPAELCERITFFKITCSITGLQFDNEGSSHLGPPPDVFFPTVPTEQLTEILGEYLACYGVLLNAAFFPGVETKPVYTPATIDFSTVHRPPADLPNPFTQQDARFEAPGQPRNRLVDIYPQDGDGLGELEVPKSLVVTLPETPRIAATLVHYSETGVTMQAFRGPELVGTQKSGPEQGQTHSLAVEADGIDRVVLSVGDDGDAALLSFTYFTATEAALELSDYPHITDFEPKTRDLYQAATEEGEILTASRSEVRTDKTLSHTNSTETGISASAKATIGVAELGGSLSHSWGETSQDTNTTQIDSSRDRREREATTTNISQMYNLLTGYHLGTNRAVFLLLPRPHTLQPTDRRSFIQGLRMIEGIQEFFVVVGRPSWMDKLCVEVNLETAHMPEQGAYVLPPPIFETGQEDFLLTAESRNDAYRDLKEFPSSTYKIEQGWIIDRTQGDPLHPGISDLGEPPPGTGQLAVLNSYNYQATADDTVTIMGTVGPQPGNNQTFLRRAYTVFKRREHPLPPIVGRQVIANLTITHRGLCVCMKKRGDCIEVVMPPEPTPVPVSIVDEHPLSVDGELIDSAADPGSRLPLMKHIIRNVHMTLTSSGSHPSRRPIGEVGYLESDHFTRRVRDALPQRLLRRPLSELEGVPSALVERLGPQTRIRQVLDWDLTTFARRGGLEVAEAAKVRRRLLGIVAGEEPPQESGPGA